MISKLDKVMDNLEKEKKLQTETTQEPTKEELVRIDEVMNAVHKVIHQLFRQYSPILCIFLICSVCLAFFYDSDAKSHR